MDEKEYNDNWKEIMSSKNISKRKKLRKKEKEMALKAWEDSNNEGTIIEKKYWVHGFVIGLNYEKENLDE